MAGHSKFKNIQHRKGAQDKKRGKIFTKLVREIITAVKLYGADQNNNPRLKTAIVNSRSQNLPKERIERAISQALNPLESDNFVEIRYEGFASGGIAIIVEALTDNKNRTASDVRAAFTKFGGNLGETGSVSFGFDHLGIIEYSASTIDDDKIFELGIEAGAQDVISDEEMHIIYTKIEDLNSSLEILRKKCGIEIDSYIGWLPHNKILINNKDQAEKIFKLIDALEDSDDVQKVYSNYELSEDLSKD